MRSRRKLNCTNCKEPMERQHLFQGVVVCERCHRIVTHCVRRAQTEMKMLYLTYTDMLRQALVEGKMNFPVLPKGTRMPRREMDAALRRAAGKIGGFDAEGQASKSDGEVRVLRDIEADSGVGLQRGGNSETISRRR